MSPKEFPKKVQELFKLQSSMDNNDVELTDANASLEDFLKSAPHQIDVNFLSMLGSLQSDVDAKQKEVTSNSEKFRELQTEVFSFLSRMPKVTSLHLQNDMRGRPGLTYEFDMKMKLVKCFSEEVR